MKILYLSNIPSPYMVNYLNELGKLCDLTVVFEKKSSSERGGRWNNYVFKSFKGVILKGISTGVDSSLSLGVFKYIKNHKKSVIIVTNPSTPTGILAILYMKFRKIPFILESEGGFAKTGKGLKERLKKILMKNAKYYFSTNKIGDEYFLKYGATEDKLVKYPFTSLFKKDLRASRTIEEQELLRIKYRIKGRKTAVAVGRFIKLKNFEWLIKEWTRLDNDFYLYLIGEGEEKNNYIKIINSNNLSNIEILDFMESNDLLEILGSFDLLIHPTLSDVWGLVVNEALSQGVPVITTPMCIAGNELIKNDFNGFVMNPDENMITRVEQLFRNPHKLQEMSKNSIESIKTYTFEQMAKIHIDEISKWEK